MAVASASTTTCFSRQIKASSSFPSPPTPATNFRCSAAGGQTGFFTRLSRLIKEKAKSDVEKLFSGFSKTRENLAVVDELLLYWNLSDSERLLDELEEALLVSDFGPRISIKIVDRIRDDVLAGKLKTGSEIKDALKRNVLELLTAKGVKIELQLGFRKPAVIMVVGVNGGGKTTSLGKLAWRLKNEGVKILMAAGDTFRAAAGEQLEVWAERTGSEIVLAEGEKVKAPSVLSQAVKRGKTQGYDVILCDTSGRLHTNYSLMEELVACKKAVAKVIPGAPNEILLVLDGTTGLNMLPQAREFNETILGLKLSIGWNLPCAYYYRTLVPIRISPPEAQLPDALGSIDAHTSQYLTTLTPSSWLCGSWSHRTDPNKT